MMMPFCESYYERIYDKDLSDLNPSFKSCSGSRVKPTYSPVIEDGRIDLKESGSVDLYAEIQSHKDSCDVNLIVARCIAGDTSALVKHQGFFADVTEIPDNYAAVLQKIEDAKLVFADLPVEVRKEFNNDPIEFISSFGSDKFMNVFKSEVSNDVFKSEASNVVAKEVGSDVEKSE